MNEAINHLICEFYAGGNIVLTDHDYKIISFFRKYKSENELININFGNIYSIHSRQILIRPTVEILRASIAKVREEKPQTPLRESLTKIFVVGVEMIESCLLSLPEPIDPKTKLLNFSDDLIPVIVESLEKAYEFVTNPQKKSGYIIYSSMEENKKDKSNIDRGRIENNELFKGFDVEEDDDNNIGTSGDLEKLKKVILKNYVPYKFQQYKDDSWIVFKDFDSAVDEYHSHLEDNKINAENYQKEKSMSERIKNVKNDNEMRIAALQAQETSAKKSAQLILNNLESVDKIISILNTYLENGMPWKELKELIEKQKKRGDRLASMIYELDLEKNKAKLILCDQVEECYSDIDHAQSGPEDDDCDVEKKDILQIVAIDLGINAYKNSNSYYSSKKKANEKKEKTADAAELAIKKTEERVKADLKEISIKINVSRLHKKYWFEKFYWFISSDGYIVISGRDDQQNELIYRYYLTSKDIYVHSDVPGANACVIKNYSDRPVPIRTLNEAGVMTVCHSSAWKNKNSCSAWWVYENQVSKTALNGEYAIDGSFVIRGNKNYLPPSPLIMGFGILFVKAGSENFCENKTVSDDSNDDEKYQNSEDGIQKKYEFEAQNDNNGENSENKNSVKSNEKYEDKDNYNHVGDNIDDNNNNNNNNSEINDDDNNNNNNNNSEINDDNNDTEINNNNSEINDDNNDTDINDNNEAYDKENNDLNDEKEDDVTQNIYNSKYKISFNLSEDSDEEYELISNDNKNENNSSRSNLSSGSAGITRKRILSRYERRQLKKGKTLEEINRMKNLKKDEFEKSKNKVKDEDKIIDNELLKSNNQKVDECGGISKTGTNSDGDNNNNNNNKSDISETTRNPDNLLNREEDEKVNKLSTVPRPNSRKAKKIEQERLNKQRQQGKLNAKEKIKTRNLVLEKEEKIRFMLKEGQTNLLMNEDLRDCQSIRKELTFNPTEFTRNPKSDDKLLYAIGICGPYESFSDYKYKVKLTPGTMKKAKTTKVAVEAFISNNNNNNNKSLNSEREKQLIKLIPSTDLSLNIISNVKVQMPGLNSLINQKKTKNHHPN